MVWPSFKYLATQIDERWVRMILLILLFKFVSVIILPCGHFWHLHLGPCHTICFCLFFVVAWHFQVKLSSFTFSRTYVKEQQIAWKKKRKCSAAIQFKEFRYFRPVKSSIDMKTVKFEHLWNTRIPIHTTTGLFVAFGLWVAFDEYAFKLCWQKPNQTKKIIPQIPPAAGESVTDWMRDIVPRKKMIRG